MTVRSLGDGWMVYTQGNKVLRIPIVRRCLIGYDDANDNNNQK
ncbi:MAG TPA: hypothetical protein VMY59_03285 [Candidatus Thermoplasmatota archaeon]|nr:hypothetical protein [Candidatus Thermoplasmatota archaeon]